MIFDIECDGLNPTKIHVMSYEKGGKVYHTHDYDEMRELLTTASLLIGHNIILFDIPVVERLLSIKVGARLIDTLPLSWYLNHSRISHGLDSYGRELGIPKPKIDNWDDLSPEEYAYRCDEDVKINSRLWNELRSKLLKLYVDKGGADKLIDYLMFKMDTVREQERSRWKLDKKLAEDTLASLLGEQEEKIADLVKAMPQIKIYTKKSRPSKPYKKDATYSVAGAKWFALLKQHNLPEDYSGEIATVVGVQEPNPNSHEQVKDWLFSLGWKPTTCKFVKEGGVERKIPQVRVDGEDGKELCKSVLKLADKEPAILTLQGLTVIQHRASIFKGFLRDEVDGYLSARVAGLTNTLRFKHRELVNLPSVNKPYGKEIRGSLVAREGHILCGSDMVSLEATTKKHYMYPYDPDYVNEMSIPGFDEHLDLAKQAGEVTQEDIDRYNQKIPDVVARLKPIRNKFKPANYACVYGVMAPRLSRETGLPKSEAQRLIDLYWERNWAVKEVSKNVVVKKVDGEMWLLNPVSNLWYSLRYEKDIFSTLNQGTGVYCFDTWIKHFRKVRPQITGQFHDEVILEIKDGAQEKCEKLLREAIDKTNKELILNVLLDIDIQFGRRYSEIH